jgi:hypothetical protein
MNKTGVVTDLERVVWQGYIQSAEDEQQHDNRL